MNAVSYVKYKERINLACYIDSYGIEIEKCSYYRKYNIPYVLSESESTRCSNYIRFKYRCDVGSMLVGEDRILSPSD